MWSAPFLPWSLSLHLSDVFWVVWLMSTSCAVTHPDGLLIASCPLLPDHGVLVLGQVLEALSESCRGGHDCVPGICRQGHERVHPCGFITNKILTQMQTCTSSLKPTYSLFSLFFFLISRFRLFYHCIAFLCPAANLCNGVLSHELYFLCFPPELVLTLNYCASVRHPQGFAFETEKIFPTWDFHNIKIFLLWNISSTEKSIYNIRLEFREKYWNGLVYPSDCLQNRTMPVPLHILCALLRSHPLLCSGQPRSILGINQSSSGWFCTCMSP